MIRSALTAVFALAALSSFAAKGDEPFVAKPLTEKLSFTPGIEGPGCDSVGNLYVVNFKKRPGRPAETPVRRGGRSNWHSRFSGPQKAALTP